MAKKIALFSHHSTLNGAERCLCESAITFKNLGYEVFVFLPSNGPLLDELKKSGVINIIILESCWWISKESHFNIFHKVKFMKLIFYFVRKSLLVIKNNEFDFIISNTIASPIAAILAFIIRKKHYWFIHEYGKEDHGYNFIFGERLSCYIINALSRKVIVNSNGVYKKYSKYIDKERLQIVNYEVKIPLRYSIVAQPRHLTINEIFTLILPGRISTSKGQIDAVMAIAFLVNVLKVSNIKLILLGSNDNDPYFDQIKKVISGEKLSNNIEIKAFVADPFQEIIKAKLLLMCSRMEAFGRVTIEAMKLGIPVIATKLGGSIDIINEGHNGLFYEAGNYIDLATKILTFKNSIYFYEQASKKSYIESNEDYSCARYNNSLKNILENDSKN